MNDWSVYIAFFMLSAMCVLQARWARQEHEEWKEICDRGVEMIEERDRIIADLYRVLEHREARIRELESEGEEWKQI